MNHAYISTACQHEHHTRCIQSCKFCDAPCLCPCHAMKDQDVRLILRELQQIKQSVVKVYKQGEEMGKELDTLATKVEETTTVEQSAIELLNGLSAQIASLKEDPAALQALADNLSAKSTELAAAVAANTPAAEQ